MQSSETSGFQAMNCACVMLKVVSMDAHESPDTTVYHSLQFDAVPGIVGPDGVDPWAKTPAARERNKSPRREAIFKTSVRLGA